MPPLAGRAATALLAVIGLLTATIAPASAQEPAGTLERAELRADLTAADGAGVPVTLTYRLRPGAGADRVPLAVLPFGGTSITALESELGGEPVPVERLGGGRAVTGRSGREGLRTEYTIPLPARRPDVVELTLRYRVEGGATGPASARRIRIPVVAAGWPPAEALPGTFVATARLPDDAHVYESFPARGRAMRDDAGRAYRVSLQVVPAVVSLRATRGAAPVITLRRVVDGGLVVLALLALLAGWRYMGRRTAALEQEAAT